MTQPAPITPLDRLLRAFRALVAMVSPNLLYFATWEYAVQGVNADGTIDASPTEQGLPLPSLPGWPYRPSLAGTTCTPRLGTICYVTFANGDPTKPILVNFEPPPPSGPSDALPTATRIDADRVTVGDPAAAPPFVARVGDTVLGGSLTLSPGTQTLNYVPPGGGPPVVSPPATILLQGTINSGSTKLRSE